MGRCALPFGLASAAPQLAKRGTLGVDARIFTTTDPTRARRRNYGYRSHGSAPRTDEYGCSVARHSSRTAETVASIRCTGNEIDSSAPGVPGNDRHTAQGDADIV